MYIQKLFCMFFLCHILLAYAEAAAVSTVAPKENNNNIDKNKSTRNTEQTLFEKCPNMLQHVFEGAAPQEQTKAGVFSIFDNGEMHLTSCIAACCAANNNQSSNSNNYNNNNNNLNSNTNCNVVFVHEKRCYHVRCFNNLGCLPKKIPKFNQQNVKMVLVQPIWEHDIPISWAQLLREKQQYQELQHYDPLNEILNNMGSEVQPPTERVKLRYSELPATFWQKPMQHNSVPYDDEEFPLAEKRDKQLMLSPMEETSDNMPYFGSSHTAEAQRSCDMDLPDIIGRHCGLLEQCVHGVCKCKRGYIRNELRECVYPSDVDYSQMASEMVSAAVNDDDTKLQDVTPPIGNTSIDKHLIVTVASKVVRLPEQQVTLTANTQPSELESGSKYKYLWTLVTQPKGPINGTITDQSESTIRLSHLSEGLYSFKVTVTGEKGLTGYAEANVTVLPLKRQNSAPVAIITPKEQTIRQPTTNAVLDGSTSSDDAKIVSWHWEVVQAPLGYQPQLPEVTTLQLSDLTIPGNYTFKLTVMDSDNVTNSTTANITVLKGTDYPPVANAGDAVILYLPNNNVTLNGTASTDDHEIVAWEWTKDASDEAKAVDMQKTRTPYLQLSNLEEGMYTFVLKVTDGSNQSSMAKVHVFVKPPSNSPPKAKAGLNTTSTLPQNWAILNGTESTDDIKIVKYEWKMISGPRPANILKANASVANATSLTLGLYQFELTVTDENNNTASDSVWVKIVQEKNAPPVANAGGDLSVTLPISALYLNGSKSTDDLAVAKYLWVRDGSSLAAGTVLKNTDKEAVLILTNLVQGHYVFKLTVSDEQGLTSTDTARVTVHEDPLLMNLVELTLPLSALDLTQSELDTIVQKIGLLLGDMKIHMRDLKYDSKSQATILVFYAQETDDQGNLTPVDGLFVEQTLKEKLLRDAKILGTVFADVRTTICQNKCSDHGDCNSITRACMCEAFWMPSAAYLMGFEEANCDWSILYVFVAVLMFFLLLSGIFWGISLTFCQKKRKTLTKKQRSRPKAQKYSLIGTQDEEAPHHIGRTNSLTDSETDSDVLFETRTKPNGILRNNGTSKRHGHVGGKYTNIKLGRKVKA